MYIEELRAGDPVTLEVIWGQSSFEINTEVVGSNGSGVIVKPYIYNDEVVNFSAGRYKDLVFNLHGVDKENGERKVFRSVTVTLKRYKGQELYVVNARGFGLFGVSSERRGNNRMVLEVPGIVEFDNGQRIEARIHDISSTGISFYAPDALLGPADKVIIHFTDMVRGKTYSLHLRTRLVRTSEENIGTLYAGQYEITDTDLLNYVLMKRMDNKAMKKAMEEE